MAQHETTHRDTTHHEGDVDQTPQKTRTPLRAKVQLTLAFILLGALIAAGAFLPARIANSFDSLLLDEIEVQALIPDDGLPSVTTPLIDRLKLLATPPSKLMVLPLQTGGHLDKETIGKILDRELDDLRARGLYPTNEMAQVSLGAHVPYTAEVSLYLLSTQPDVNGIIWEISFSDELFSSRFYLDDESEKVLGYSVTYQGPAEDVFTEQSGERWMDYLGLTVGKLQVTKETGESATANGKHTLDAPDVSGDSAASSDDAAVSPKSAVASDGAVTIETTILEKRFRFTLETKTSPLEFCYEQYRSGEMRSISLRIVSSKQPNQLLSPLEETHTATPAAVTEPDPSFPPSSVSP
jgi:hypothetical protein